MNDKECDSAFAEGYRQGRMEAADAVRTACYLIGGDAALNIHLIAAAAEG